MNIKKIMLGICCLVLLSSICVAEDLSVTSLFGWRIHPITGEWKFHSGIDLGYAYGTGIPALFDGQVFQAGDYQDGYGNQVLIYHPQIDAYTRYAHCSMLYVTIGQNVSVGQMIASVGSTGNSTGPHLHLEYIVHGENGGYEYIDPAILWY